MSPTPKNKTGLGRGIDVLLPQDFDKSVLLDESERIQKIAVGKLEANKAQPRTHFDKDAISSLAASIKRHGVLQPLIVSPSNQDDRYTIIAGERRWRAAQEAGLASVPVIVRSTEKLERLEIALVENVQRVDLSPLEQAVSIDRLHQQFNLSYQVIGERLGKAESTVHNIARLLQLPPKAAEALKQEKISEGHARTILALKDRPDKQEELLQSILKSGWSVRQAERFVVAVKDSDVDTKTAKTKVKTETPETKVLSKHIKAPVTLRRTAHGGKLEIAFDSDKDLARIMKWLLQ